MPPASERAHGAQTPRHLLCHGELVVVETEDDIFLGTAEASDGWLIVRSGFVGRPVVLDLADVERVTPASEHPCVVNADDPDDGAIT